jgi:hypothetical protein
VSIDCKATVLIGEVSRGGLTRGDNQACDHDLGLHEKYIPWGIVEEDRGQLSITFGSSYKTSDFIVDALEAWWAALDEAEQVAMARLQIKMDNGPESSGKRTQFLHRMVAFCDAIGKPIQLLYYPPYHSKYNPIERCWGILELHWNGTKLVDVETMVEWAKTMTWKGIHPGEWPPSCQAASSRADSEAVSDTGEARSVVTSCPRLSHCWASQPLQS